jgi:hypothetical protein
MHSIIDDCGHSIIAASRKWSGWPDWAKFCHLGNFLWRWVNFYVEKIAQWFGQNFSQPWKNCPKLTLTRLKFCSKRVFFTCLSKIFKKFYLLFYVKKTIKECPVPLDISIKSNRKHHKTVLYSKSNKNIVGQLWGNFSLSLGDFFTKTSGHPANGACWMPHTPNLFIY